MSNYRRPRSKNDDDRDEGGFAQDSDQKIAASNTRTRDSADGKGGQPVRAQNTINRGPVQGRNILDRSSPGGSTNDQILASIPAAQLALTDLSGIQALPLQIGSEQLLSMALQHALYQGLGAMNTTSRSRPQLPTNVAGARSSTLEGKNASRTSHPDTSRLSTTSMMRLLTDMTDARNEQLPTWSADLLRQQASIPQHNLPSTSIKDHTNAAISSQRRFHPIYQQGNSHVLSSLAASDPFLSIALHNALQQQHDTITSNQSTNHVAANINHAISSGADIKMILNALASQLGAVLPPTPTPTLPIQLLGTPPDLSVPSRLQQLLSERAIGTTNRVATPPNTIEQPHSAAVLAIAALLLQVGDGRGALTHTSLGTDGSAMSTTSTAHSTYGRDAERTVVGIRQNRTPSPLVGMARPHPTLPILQSIPLLQDPAVLAALPAVLSMTGGGIPQVVQSAPTRHHGIDPSLSLAVRGPLGHIEDKTLPRVLHVPSDDDSLSPYQCLVRRQIELFEASEADIHATAQGRNRPIIVGQVGIRCIHCGRLPIERRARGAVYFPSTLISTYQTAQNMANSHLIKDCLDIPKCIREDLVRIRLRENSESQNTRKSAFGGGRAYWARGLQTNHGVIETEDRRLKFDSSSIVG